MSFFLQRWLGACPWPRQDVAQAVERLIDQVDPKVRLLPRSEQQLQRGVRDTLRYAGELTSHLPEPLDFSVAGYSSDRRVGLLFASPDSLSRLLHDSQPLHDYFSRPANPDQAYVLLVMQAQTRQRLGSQLLPDGNVQNDVPQQVLSFAQHRIVAAYDSLPLLQHWAGMEAYNALCRDLARRVGQSDAYRQQLEAERQRVLLRLASSGQTLVNAGALRGGHDVKDADLPARLQALDAELALLAAGLSLPGKLDYLRQVVRQPQQHLNAALESACLDRMGVVTPEHDGGIRLDFGVLRLGQDEVRERVVFPARLSRQDVQQWRQRWPQGDN